MFPSNIGFIYKMSKLVYIIILYVYIYIYIYITIVVIARCLPNNEIVKSIKFEFYLLSMVIDIFPMFNLVSSHILCTPF